MVATPAETFPKISVHHTCYRQIGSKSTNHSPLTWRKEGLKVALVAATIVTFRPSLRHFRGLWLVHLLGSTTWAPLMLEPPLVLEGCDSWISIQSVDNTHDWRKFWKRFRGCFVFESRVSTKTVVKVNSWKEHENNHSFLLNCFFFNT